MLLVAVKAVQYRVVVLTEFELLLRWQNGVVAILESVYAGLRRPVFGKTHAL